MSEPLEQRFKKAIPLTLAGELNEELPVNKAINEISIRHTIGTLDVGNYVANTIFKRIYLEVDGEIYLDWNGEYISDVGCLGVLAGRVLQSYQVGYYGGTRNERFDIKLPDAIPAGKNKRLHVEWATTPTHISDGAATTYTGALCDVYYTSYDASPDIWEYIKTKHFEYIIAATQTGQIFLPEVKRELCIGIIFAYDDNNVLTNTAPDLKITINSIVYFDGSWLDLQQRVNNKAGYPMPTGFAVLELPGIMFGSSDVEIDYSLAAAPTAGKIHGKMILKGAEELSN